MSPFHRDSVSKLRWRKKDRSRPRICSVVQGVSQGARLGVGASGYMLRYINTTYTMRSSYAVSRGQVLLSLIIELLRSIRSEAIAVSSFGIFKVAISWSRTQRAISPEHPTCSIKSPKDTCPRSDNRILQEHAPTGSSTPAVAFCPQTRNLLVSLAIRSPYRFTPFF